MTAPERIWADWDKMYPEQNGGQWWGEKCNATEYVRADLAAVQPAQVKVKPWSYCPECGCEEPRYGEGPHKQCARCYQEWFTDVDYSGVVRGNLERLFIAALEPQPDPRDEVIARLVEALRLMRSTYPYNPPCYGWEEQVEAHKTAKAALAAVKGDKQ